MKRDFQVSYQGPWSAAGRILEVMPPEGKGPKDLGHPYLEKVLVL